ncbi:MAG TPA: ABC transporter permease, partial [Mycobacteriales bacterium]|nr:ABC transporter permease [Mycobacteriales bacterium]
VGVLAVVTLGLINDSVRSSALALLQTGRADFTVAQSGVSDVLNSNIQQVDVAKVAGVPGVARAVGALVSTVRLNSTYPLFIEIGLNRADLEPFGVRIVQGRAYAADSTDEVLLGEQAASNLHKGVGDSIVIDTHRFTIVGIYSVGQALGDGGAMMPLQTLQTYQRQGGLVTLIFVQVTADADLADVRRTITDQLPSLTTIRTAAEFGRADRSLQLINAADEGSRILAIVVGGLIVMSMMTMAFIERIREFGVLSAVGWPRRRVLLMVLSEAGLLGLVGAIVGVALSVAAVQLLQNSSSLSGFVHLEYSAGTFWRAIYTAAGMTILGAIYPALRAAALTPLEALRHE